MSVTSYTTKKGRRWRYRLYDPMTGKTAGGKAGFHTKRAARDAEIDALAGGTITPEKTTVAEWRDLWLQTADVADATRLHYRERTEAFIAAHGTRPLGTVGRPLALEWAAGKGQGIQELSAMWSAAAHVDLVGDNPWSRLMKKRGRIIQPGWLVADDIRQLTDAALAVHGPIYGPVVRALIIVGAYVGLRPGELGGLRWFDLHPEDGLLHVGQQAHSALRTFTAPKGGRERDVAYPSVAIDAVAQMPKLHDDLVFVTKRGRILFAPNRNTIWSPVRAAAGRHGMALHELRHYTATVLLEQGLSSADAATQLGHVDGGRLIEQTYGHPRRQPAIDRVRAALATATSDPAQEATA